MRIASRRNICGRCGDRSTTDWSRRERLIQIQAPFAASDESEPEPDVAVLPVGDYSRAHPDRAWLIIEVAETSVDKDRHIKADLYAAAGVPEYWLVDLVANAVEVRTELRHGRYSRLTTHAEGVLRPEAFPDLEVPAEALLP